MRPVQRRTLIKISTIGSLVDIVTNLRALAVAWQYGDSDGQVTVLFLPLNKHIFSLNVFARQAVRHAFT